jgi:hypothetical protein
MRPIAAIAVSILTAAACGPVEDPTEPVVLIEKADLGGAWLVGPPYRPVQTGVSLVLSFDRLEVLDGAAPVWAVSVRHVDVVRCYDGCGRTCTPLNDVDRTWMERELLEILGDPAPLAALVRPVAMEHIETIEGDVCARP